jgi:uncharacterized coiled-coil protein SlyX
MEPVTFANITTGVGYASTAVVVLSVVFKGLPKFIELYTLAQESIRRSLEDRVSVLEGKLDTEREECNAKVDKLWQRIERMRQVINHLIVRVGDTDTKPLSGVLHRAYDIPPDLDQLLNDLDDVEGTEKKDD